MIKQIQEKFVLIRQQKIAKLKKNLKRLIFGAGIISLGFIPMKKSFSQTYLRADIGKDIIDFEPDLSTDKAYLSKGYIQGHTETKNFFTNLEAMMMDFGLNDYAKANLGAKLSKNKKINLNPQITAFAETEEIRQINKIESPTQRYSFKAKIGTGIILNYNLKKLKGEAEIIFPLSDAEHPLFYTRHSLKTKLGEFESFYKGKNLKNNYYGIKLTTPSKEGFNFFIEYSKNSSEIFKEKKFLNLGLAVRVEEN